MQLDRLQLQMQLVAKKSGDNHIATTMLQHTVAQLEHVMQGLTAHVAGLANAGVGAGHAARHVAAQPRAGLSTVVKVK